MPFKKGEIPQGAKPFKKGTTGNPNGRPKLPDLKEALQKVMGEEKDGHNALEAVLMALRKKATSGDVRAAEVLLSRSYGMPKQTIEQHNTGSQELIIKGKKFAKDADNA